jgi:hypothetical protein
MTSAEVDDAIAYGFAQARSARLRCNEEKLR